MSQQINLLLPELRPRFDWLGLPVVAATALAAVFLVSALTSMGALKASNLKAREAGFSSQSQTLQQQVQALGKLLAERKGDPRLPAEIELARLGVSQRQEVMAVISQGAVGDGGSGFSSYLQGFSRQTLDGVWLVGFAFSGKDIEIRGRLTDPALLPKYINQINDEAAFVGRHFANLDMKRVDPDGDKRDAGQATAKTSPSKPYTEFTLRTEQAVPVERGR